MCKRALPFGRHISFLEKKNGMQMYWGIQHPVFMHRNQLDKLPVYGTILNAQRKTSGRGADICFSGIHNEQTSDEIGQKSAESASLRVK